MLTMRFHSEDDSDAYLLFFHTEIYFTQGYLKPLPKNSFALRRRHHHLIWFSPLYFGFTNGAGFLPTMAHPWVLAPATLLVARIPDFGPPLGSWLS